MPQKIFICYRRDDSGMAGRIGDSLGIEFGRDGVFLDTDKLTLGRRFDSELMRTLNETDVFVAVIGRDWLQTLQQRQSSGQTDYVVEEIKEALRLQLSVIPLVVDDAELPDESLLPVEISNAMRWHGHNVRHESFRRDIDELIQAIYTIRGDSERLGTRSGVSLSRSLSVACVCVALIGGGWWYTQTKDETLTKTKDAATDTIVAGPTSTPTPTDDKETDNDSSGAVTDSQGQVDTLTADKDINSVGIAASNESTVSDVTVSSLVDEDRAIENVPDTGERAESTPSDAQSGVFLVTDEVENIDDVNMGSGGELTVPIERPKAQENIDVGQNWYRLDGVFPNSEFSLCGYDSFTASPVRNSDQLLLLSDDRDIPGQKFPRLRWKVQAEQAVELFEGCSAIFSYNNLAGGERIYIRVKGE